MVLHRNTGVYTQDEYAEDEEYNENYKEVSNEGANESRFFSLMSNSYVRLLYGQTIWLTSYMSVESLLYASIMLTKK